MNVCARREQRPTNLFDRAMPSRRQRCIYMNDFVKPKDQREFIRFGLARNRTFKKDKTHIFKCNQGAFALAKAP